VDGAATYVAFDGASPLHLQFVIEEPLLVQPSVSRRTSFMSPTSIGASSFHVASGLFGSPSSSTRSSPSASRTGTAIAHTPASRSPLSATAAALQSKLDMDGASAGFGASGVGYHRGNRRHASSSASASASASMPMSRPSSSGLAPFMERVVTPASLTTSGGVAWHPPSRGILQFQVNHRLNTRVQPWQLLSGEGVAAMEHLLATDDAVLNTPFILELACDDMYFAPEHAHHLLGCVARFWELPLRVRVRIVARLAMRLGGDRRACTWFLEQWMGTYGSDIREAMAREMYVCVRRIAPCKLLAQDA